MKILFAICSCKTAVVVAIIMLAALFILMLFGFSDIEDNVHESDYDGGSFNDWKSLKDKHFNGN